MEYSLAYSISALPNYALLKLRLPKLRIAEITHCQNYALPKLRIAKLRIAKLCIAKLRIAQFTPQNDKSRFKTIKKGTPKLLLYSI